MAKGFKELKREVYAGFDNMSDDEVARAIAYAKSHKSQLIMLDYVANRPDRRDG